MDYFWVNYLTGTPIYVSKVRFDLVVKTAKCGDHMACGRRTRRTTQTW